MKLAFGTKTHSLSLSYFLLPLSLFYSENSPRVLLPLEIARFSPLLRVLLPFSCRVTLELISALLLQSLTFRGSSPSAVGYKTVRYRLLSFSYSLSLSLFLSLSCFRLFSLLLSLFFPHSLLHSCRRRSVFDRGTRYIRQNNFRIPPFPRKIISSLFLKYTLWKFGILSTKPFPKMVNYVY